MPIHVFSIPARGCSASAHELNLFLQSRRIVSVERQLVSENGVAFWSFCVEYLERGATSGPIDSPATSRSSKGKVDYREVLSESEFIIFAKLRDLRKVIAAEEGVPVYAIFTNEQLAAFVRDKAATKADLGQVTGVGEGRLEKYGDRILACIGSSSAGSNDETS